jgi:hypothetical protein
LFVLQKVITTSKMSAGGESTAMEIQKEPIITTKNETLLSATTGDAFEEGLLKLYYGKRSTVAGFSI